MKIVFFGTPEYVIPILDALHKKLRTKASKSPIKAVITQPPKPAGRKQKLSYSSVDEWARGKNVTTHYNTENLITNNTCADLGVLASYKEIIPTKIIKLFPHGILNVHPSMLPLFRGSSPVQATIITQNQAGVSIIKLDEKLDHGPIISQFKEDVLPEDTTQSLRARLFEKSAHTLATLIPAYVSGKIRPQEQDHSKATFTSEVKKSDAFVPPKYIDTALQGSTPKAHWQIPFIKNFTTHYSPLTIHNFARAMQPWPCAWTIVKINNKELRLKIIKSHLVRNTKYQVPSTEQKLVFDLVQLEGKTEVSWKQFKEGYPQAKFS